MKWPKGALCATLLAVGSTTGLPAQELDAFVLPPGTVRFSGGGEYASYGSQFDGSGTARVGESVRGPLVASAFPPLGPLAASLSEFLTRTAGAAGATPLTLGPDALSLGEVDAALFLSRVRAPLRLEVGVLPRVQLGVSLPLVRGRQLVERLALLSPTVGGNPDPTRNAALLARVGANGSALGALPLLPTRESPAGRELQRRVRAATGGDSLTLQSSDTVPASVLQRLLVGGFGVDSVHSSAGEWRPGDVEVEARVMLLDPLRGAPLPDSLARTVVRAAAAGGIRLPTGANPDSVTLFGRDPDVGLAGYHLALAADVFFTARSWVGLTLRHVALTSGEVRRRLAPLDAPLSSTAAPELVRWSPGDTVQLRVSPRFRLADPISVGVDYELQQATGGSYKGSAGAELLETAGGMSHRVGAGVRFSSLPAYYRGEGRLPITASLSYARTLAGPEGMAASSRIQLEGSLHLALWGRGIRR